MKHVFYLHSATCIEAFLSISKHLCLNEKNIVIINARFLNGIDKKYSQIKISKELDLFPFFTHKDLKTFKWIHSNKIIKEWDNIIEKYVENIFTFYAQKW